MENSHFKSERSLLTRTLPHKTHVPPDTVLRRSPTGIRTRGDQGRKRMITHFRCATMSNPIYPDTELHGAPNRKMTENLGIRRRHYRARCSLSRMHHSSVGGRAGSTRLSVRHKNVLSGGTGSHKGRSPRKRVTSLVSNPAIFCLTFHFKISDS